VAVNRAVDEVYPGYPKPLNPEQGLPLRSSITMHTLNRRPAAARTSDRLPPSREARRSPRPGSQHPRRAAHEGVEDEGLMTMIGGKIVHLSEALAL
jgi:hypothetical protein